MDGEYAWKYTYVGENIGIAGAREQVIIREIPSIIQFEYARHCERFEGL